MPFLRERSGRWSPVKSVAFAASILPAIWIAYQAATGDLGARPVTEAIHQAGDWALRFLFVTLAITPAQRILHYPRIILARRTLGVASAGYALLHLSLYVLDQHFDLFKVASEIVLRIYLLIGAVALAGLITLASTSTDAAISRRPMLQRWSISLRAASWRHPARRRTRGFPERSKGHMPLLLPAPAGNDRDRVAAAQDSAGRWRGLPPQPSGPLASRWAYHFEFVRADRGYRYRDVDGIDPGQTGDHRPAAPELFDCCSRSGL